MAIHVLYKNVSQDVVVMK